MNSALLHLAAAFGLGAAAGLNASLPLFLVSLLARLGLLTLAPPFTPLVGDVAFWGLLGLAALELAIDKIDGADAIGHALLWPLSVTAGAILAGSQAGAIAGVDPGLLILVGLLVGGASAGTLHAARAVVRWPLRGALIPALLVSLTEDVAALSLMGTSLAAPVLVPALLLAILMGAALAALAAWAAARAARSIARRLGRAGQRAATRLRDWWGDRADARPTPRVPVPTLAVVDFPAGGHGVTEPPGEGARGAVGE